MTRSSSTGTLAECIPYGMPHAYVARDKAGRPRGALHEARVCARTTTQGLMGLSQARLRSRCQM